jgi:predicted metal-dependent phosphoesterase TrpH
MIDLHSHSTASDGADTPIELINEALNMKISALALTDHDTLAGLDEAAAACRDKPLLLLRGVELEILFPKGEFHLLGLNLRKESRALADKLRMQQQKREERNHIILDKMNKELLLNAHYNEIEALAGGVVGRIHFARYLIARGKVKTIKAAFDRYLGAGRPFYTEKEALLLEEAVALIKDAGGKSVIAHPLSLYMSWGRLPETLKNIRAAGVEGLEAYHSQCTLNEAQRLEALAGELGFFVTAGSDYHGQNRRDRLLGHTCGGRLPIENCFIEPLLDDEQRKFFNSIRTEV